MTSVLTTNQGPDCPSRFEWVGILALLAGLLVFDLASYNFYPAVWCDEVLYSEPAINLVRHGAYVSGAYEFQPPNTFPVVNCPLYGMTLVPWLACWGTTLLAVRSFNYALVALAAFLLWKASWRFNLVRSARLRLLMPLALHLGYGMSFCYRCCRPDILGMVCLLLLLLSFRLARPRLRGFCLLGLAAATPWIGLQVALYAWFACAVAYLLFTKTVFDAAGEPASGVRGAATRSPAMPGLPELALLSLGMALGAASLFLFISLKGMLGWFLPPVLGVMKGTFYWHPARHSIGRIAADYLHRVLVNYGADFSTIPPALALWLLILPMRKHLDLGVRKLVFFGLVLVFATPALFEAIGHFAFYYSYLLYAPVLIVILAAWSRLGPPHPNGAARWCKPALAASLAAAMAVGLPLRLGLVLSCSRLVPRADIQRFIGAYVSPQDTAFSDYLPFFEVKQIAPVVYHLYSSAALTPTGLPGLDLAPELRQAVSVIIVRPQSKESVSGFFGGQWHAVSEPFGDTQDFSRVTRIPLVGRRFASYPTQPQNERFQLQVFRRIGASPAIDQARSPFGPQG